MTDEQIRQNAVKYSEQHCSGYVDGGLVDAYITGAHSIKIESGMLDTERQRLTKENTGLMVENMYLMHIGSILKDCASWWKFRKHKDEIKRLTNAMEIAHKEWRGVL